jgi:ABC-type bacteriocin/lantibiotic exporter with double-glycine peptidase domain
LEEKVDYRDPMLAEKSGASGPNSHAAPTHMMSLQNLSLGWNAESKPILNSIDLRVNKGSRTAIIGAVGTGKTLLLKGIIGEAHKIHGQLILSPSASVAYCSQTAWLENLSGKQNMTQYGKQPSDSDYYRQLASDCMLEDLVGLPTFASGTIGTGGVKLSGGQRQRLVSFHMLQRTDY